MGQEHSNNGVASFLQKAKGSPKPGRAGKIVVVNAANNSSASSANDPNLLKLQSIPQFLPILRSTLGISGLKDPPDLHKKVDAVLMARIFARLEEHLGQTSQVTSNEQANLGTRIREIDFAISTLCQYLTDRQKNHAQLLNEMGRIKEINSQLTQVINELQELVPVAMCVNNYLPNSERLPDLELYDIAECAIKNAAAHSPAYARNNNKLLDSPQVQKHIDEQTVVDKDEKKSAIS